MSVVETYKQKKVHSIFIIKNKQTFFPMQPLHAVLKARFGTHPAGHWVVFQTTIRDVKVFSLAYALSQRGVSYFLLTCVKQDCLRSSICPTSRTILDMWSTRKGSSLKFVNFSINSSPYLTNIISSVRTC
jgi:hypothetical protein